MARVRDAAPSNTHTKTKHLPVVSTGAGGCYSCFRDRLVTLNMQTVYSIDSRKRNTQASPAVRRRTVRAPPSATNESESRAFISWRAETPPTSG